MAENDQQKGKFGGVEVYWTAISYKTVAILAAAVIALGLGIFFVVRPDAFKGMLSRLGNIVAGSESGASGAQATRSSQATFVNLDGEVRVRKSNAVQWVNADYRLPLEEGDMVQTSTNGIARITFVDGTTYVVKPETLIVIERNQSLQNQATEVAVQVTSGAVDLSTGTWEVAGSSSVVRFENAVARIEQNSRAAVKNDPKAKVHEITVSEGQAQLQKGGERVTLGPYERAAFADPGASLKTEKVIRPPTLSRPRNLEPIISANPKEEAVKFEWEEVAQAVGYHLRVYTSPLLTQIVLERKNLTTPNYAAKGLNPGEYWWNVIAVDSEKQESVQSQPSKFSLVEKPAGEELFMVIDNVVLHGRVVEVVGRTEPGATVIIQGEQVALLGADGHFKHFTKPLPSAGAHDITITAQNRRGEVVTRRKPIVVQ